MTAHEGTGMGLGGGNGEGVSLGKALGEALGVAVTSDAVGLATAVGEEPHPATARRTTSAPTPSLRCEKEPKWFPLTGGRFASACSPSGISMGLIKD